MGDTYEGSQEALLDQLDRLELVATALEEALETVVARLVRVEAGLAELDQRLGQAEELQRGLAELDQRLGQAEELQRGLAELDQRLGQAEELQRGLGHIDRMEHAVISVVSVAEQRVAAMHKEGTEDRNALRDLIRKVEDLAKKQTDEVQERLDHLDTNFDSVARAAVRRALKDMSNDR